MRLPEGDDVRRLALRFAEHDYTVNGLEHMLGAVAASALARDEAVPARRVLASDRSALSLIARLFLMASTVNASEVTQIFGPLSSLGELIEVRGSQVRGRFEIAPHQVDDINWWIAADWPISRVSTPPSPDHVLGVGGASTLLAQATVRRDVGTALDVGTGCGIQALHLAQHAQEVVATDISGRCLELARFNAVLNDLRVEFVKGSLFDPVKRQTFDTIVSNPPFVIGSPPGAQYTYRDGGMEGDQLCAELVTQAHSHLNPGGYFQMLANWQITDADDWSRAPRQWLSDSPLDAWVIQRDVQDPAAYVANWLADVGAHATAEYESNYQRWLSVLEDSDVLAIGFGVVSLRANASHSPIRVFQHADQPVVQPIGPDIARWFEAHDLLAHFPDRELLDLPLQCTPTTRITRETSPVNVGANVGVNVAEDAISVWRTHGFAWTAPIDEFGAQLLAAADGEASIGRRLAELAARYQVESDVVAATALPLLSRLVVEGFLWLPPDSP